MPFPCFGGPCLPDQHGAAQHALGHPQPPVAKANDGTFPGMPELAVNPNVDVARYFFFSYFFAP